jgi:hypothetical protein
MLDVAATVILAGMMFVPVLNIFVGVIVGAGLFGFAGGCAGAALAVSITIAERQINRDRRPFWSPPTNPRAQVTILPEYNRRRTWSPLPAYEALLRVETAEDEAIAAALRNLAANTDDPVRHVPADGEILLRAGSNRA